MGPSFRKAGKIFLIPFRVAMCCEVRDDLHRDSEKRHDGQRDDDSTECSVHRFSPVAVPVKESAVYAARE